VSIHVSVSVRRDFRTSLILTMVLCYKRSGFTEPLGLLMLLWHLFVGVHHTRLCFLVVIWRCRLVFY